MQEPNYER